MRVVGGRTTRVGGVGQGLSGGCQRLSARGIKREGAQVKGREEREARPFSSCAGWGLLRAVGVLVRAAPGHRNCFSS